MPTRKSKYHLRLVVFVSLFFFFSPSVFASDSQVLVNKKPSVVANIWQKITTNKTNSTKVLGAQSETKKDGIFRDIYCTFNWRKDSSCVDYRQSSLSQNDNGTLEEQVNIVSTTDNSGLTVLQVQMIKGEKGDKGDRGEPGKDGLDGQNGFSESQGPKGDKGDKGDTGAAGSGTTYAAGAGISISGSTISSSLGTTIEASELADNSCTAGQTLEWDGDSWECGDDGGGTSYSAGSGLSLTSTTFALDLTNANTWTGVQTFSNGFILGSNNYTNLAGTGLSFSSGTLSSSLGTTIESAEITNGTVVAADIADATLTLAKLAQNSCGDNQIIKWNGSAWACGADNNDTYTASTGLALSSGAFSVDINGLSAVSSVASTDTVAVYTASGLKKITRSDMFSDVLGSMNYRGTWNATTNSPALTSSTGTKGYYYVVSTSGTTALDGISSWAVNDWAVFNGSSWEKVQTTNAVTSVFGRTGAVIASGGDYNASQITNTASGNIAAITVQNALNELDSEKLGTTLNSGLVFVGNVSNVATGVALSGDITIDNTGVVAIGADKVVLSTDTTGNYVATLADSGESVFTIAGSGTEDAAVTIALAADILDFTKFADAMTLDSSSSMTLGGNDLTFAITGAGLPKYTRTSAGQWLNFADGTDSFGVYNIAGTPEAAIAADKGSLAIDTTNGKLYIKTTDTLNTDWSELAAATTGMLSLNGLTGQTQTFAAGTTGTDFAISSSGTTHTFNLPDASATNRGLITTGTQTIAGAKTLSSALTLSGSAANLILGSNYLSGDGDDEGIYVTSTGSVGIGLSSPAHKLHIYSPNNTGAAAAVFAGDHYGVAIITQDSTTPYAFNVISGATDELGSGGTSRLFVRNDGKVGIGTTVPEGNLHVTDSIVGGSNTHADDTVIFEKNDNNVVNVISSPTNSGAIAFSDDERARGYVLYDHSGDNMQFATNGVEKIRILSNGNVGIGTTNPGTQLSIVNPNYPGVDTLPAAGSIGGKLSLLNDAGRYGLLFGNLSNGNSFVQSQRVDGTATTYSLLLNPNGGNVGIGTVDPGLYKLYVTGNAYSTGTWGTSDERYKTNITALEGSLDKILQLEGVTFNWKQDEYPDMGFDDSKQIGLIAQNVEQILPELVKTNDDGYKALAYDKITAVLIGAVQEQQGLILNNSSDIESLLVNNNSESAVLADLLSRVESMESATSNGEFNTLVVLNKTTLNTLETTGAVSFKGEVNFFAKTIFNQVAEFIDSVTFKKDVVFEDEATFNKGIEIKDRITGEIYCSYVENGESKTWQGHCEDLPALEVEATTSEEVTPTPEPTSEPTVNSSPEVTPTVTPTPTPTIEPATLPEEATPSATPIN